MLTIMLIGQTDWVAISSWAWPIMLNSLHQLVMLASYSTIDDGERQVSNVRIRCTRNIDILIVIVPYTQMDHPGTPFLFQSSSMIIVRS